MSRRKGGAEDRDESNQPFLCRAIAFVKRSEILIVCTKISASHILKMLLVDLPTSTPSRLLAMTHAARLLAVVVGSAPLVAGSSVEPNAETTRLIPAA